MALLDRVLDSLDLDTVWVSVPEDNPAALGLFEKLGFVREETREVCGRRDDTALKVCILAIDARARRGRQAGGNTVPVITISGLPGSGSEVVGLEVARLLGSRYVDDGITERLRRRLRCSVGELRSLEQSTLSLWSRLLRAIAIPVAWPATSDIGFHPLMSDPIADFGLAEDQITRERYLEGLSAVIARLSAEGGVVIHGHGTPRLVPSQLGADHVFLSASQASRQRRIAAERGLGASEALTLVRRMDREAIALNKNLYGGDLLDMSQYDLVLNLDRISLESAARVVAGAFRVPSPQGNIWTEEAAPPSRVAAWVAARSTTVSEPGRRFSGLLVTLRLPQVLLRRQVHIGGCHSEHSEESGEGWLLPSCAACTSPPQTLHRRDLPRLLRVTGVETGGLATSRLTGCSRDKAHRDVGHSRQES